MQEYFSDGLTEDIITSLAAWRSFPVVARNSTFAHKNQSPDVRQVAEDLSVRYVLEGSVRKSGNRVRITPQLIDGLTGNHLWANRCDRDLEDVFALQDEITSNIIAAVQPEMRNAEMLAVTQKRPDNLSGRAQSELSRCFRGAGGGLQSLRITGRGRALRTDVF